MYPFLRIVPYTKVFGNLFLCLPPYSRDRATKFHSDIPGRLRKNCEFGTGSFMVSFYDTLGTSHYIVPIVNYEL